jgi:hypothetical protein
VADLPIYDPELTCVKCGGSLAPMWLADRDVLSLTCRCGWTTEACPLDDRACDYHLMYGPYGADHKPCSLKMGHAGRHDYGE